MYTTTAERPFSRQHAAGPHKNYNQYASTKYSTFNIPSDSNVVYIYEPASSRNPQSRRYIQGRLLGMGGFAQCYEVTLEPEGTKYAAKVIEKKTLTRRSTRSKLQSEIMIHASVRHRHIVKFERYFHNKQYVYILLEICQCRSMMELMREKKVFTEEESKYFMLQIIDAVQYMHDNRIIHRDLKLGNLLLNNDMEIKIGDFGLATQLSSDEERKNTICGTPNYIAPEILSKLPHGYEVDIWSIGIILYTLLVGKSPFETYDVKQTFKKIRVGHYRFPKDSRISHRARDLIASILQNDPRQRPSLKEIISHPFFSVNPVGIHSCPDSLKEYTTAVLASRSKSRYRSTVAPHATGIENQNAPRATKGIRNPKDFFTKQSTQVHTATDPNGRAPLRRIRDNVQSQQQPSHNVRQPPPLEKKLPSGKTHTTRGPSPRKVTSHQTRHGEAVGTKTYPTHLPDKENAEDEKNIQDMHMTLEQSLADINNGKTLKNLGDGMKKMQLGQREMSSPVEDTSSKTQGTISSSRTSEESSKDAPFAASRKTTSMKNISSPSGSSVVTQPDIGVEGPRIWVTQWADFTEKYGMAYLMSDSTVGALYNDYSKMVFNPNGGRIEYWERAQKNNGAQDERIVFSLHKFPSELYKKVRLISEFNKYLTHVSQTNLAAAKGETPKVGATAYQCGQTDPQQVKAAVAMASMDESSFPSSIFVKRWLLTQHAIIFRMSNRTVQVLFHDRSEIILASEARLVTYTSSSGQRETFPLEACRMGQLSEISVRLKYAKDIILSLVGSPAPL